MVSPPTYSLVPRARQRTIVLNDADDFCTVLLKELGGVEADVAEPQKDDGLAGDAGHYAVLGAEVFVREEVVRGEVEAEPRGLRSALDAALRERLASDAGCRLRVGAAW